MLAIKNGLVFYKNKFVNLDLAVEDGKIAAIGKNLKADEHFDAVGLLVLPGLIDPHVHLREPGAEYKEDFATGSRAAIAGGFTTVMDMPNNPQPTVSVARYREKQQLAAKAVCNILFHFGATDANFGEAKKAGAGSMKIYLGKTTGELFLKQPDSLEKHFASFNGNFVFHAAVPAANEPQEIENTCGNINAVGLLAKKYKRKAHIAHVSAAAEAIAAKKHKLTAEVAPHYLFLSTKDAEKLGFRGTVYPNLRSDGIRRKLWDELPTIDCIATDHAPHTLEDKQKGARGFPGLETSLAVMLQAYSERLLSLEWLVAAMSEKSAAIFGLKGRGKIEKGAAADITLVDLKKEWTVDGSELETKCKWSPFEGKKLKGKVKAVFVGGKLIFDGYSFL
ncbi:MAG: dihydroorotase family protein [Candidatus Micrarchaeota archaeon]